MFVPQYTFWIAWGHCYFLAKLLDRSMNINTVCFSLRLRDGPMSLCILWHSATWLKTTDSENNNLKICTPALFHSRPEENWNKSWELRVVTTQELQLVASTGLCYCIFKKNHWKTVVLYDILVLNEIVCLNIDSMFRSSKDNTFKV